MPSEHAMITSSSRYLIVQRKTLLMKAKTTTSISPKTQLINSFKKHCLVVRNNMEERKIAKNNWERLGIIKCNRVYKKRKYSLHSQISHTSQIEENSTRCRRIFAVCRTKLTTYNRNSRKLTTSRQVLQLTTKDHLF